jgi:site-specific DNA-methyltransferase (adenine-specific)
MFTKIASMPTSTSPGRKTWGEQVKRVLKPDGTFWLAIRDDFAAELKVLFTRELGFSCRSWVIWYYTFGVNCTKKFGMGRRRGVGSGQG